MCFRLTLFNVLLLGGICCYASLYQSPAYLRLQTPTPLHSTQLLRRSKEDPSTPNITGESQGPSSPSNPSETDSGGSTISYGATGSPNGGGRSSSSKTISESESQGAKKSPSESSSTSSTSALAYKPSEGGDKSPGSRSKIPSSHSSSGDYDWDPDYGEFEEERRRQHQSGKYSTGTIPFPDQQGTSSTPARMGTSTIRSHPVILDRPDIQSYPLGPARRLSNVRSHPLRLPGAPSRRMQMARPRTLPSRTPSIPSYRTYPTPRDNASTALKILKLKRSGDRVKEKKQNDVGMRESLSLRSPEEKISDLERQISYIEHINRKAKIRHEDDVRNPQLEEYKRGLEYCKMIETPHGRYFLYNRPTRREREEHVRRECAMLRRQIEIIESRGETREEKARREKRKAEIAKKERDYSLMNLQWYLKTPQQRAAEFAKRPLNPMDDAKKLISSIKIGPKTHKMGPGDWVPLPPSTPSTKSSSRRVAPLRRVGSSPALGGRPATTGPQLQRSSSVPSRMEGPAPDIRPKTPEQAAETPERAAGTPERAAGTPERAVGTPQQAAETPEQAAAHIQREIVLRLQREEAHGQSEAP